VHALWFIVIADGFEAYGISALICVLSGARAKLEGERLVPLWGEFCVPIIFDHVFTSCTDLRAYVFSPAPLVRSAVLGQSWRRKRPREPSPAEPRSSKHARGPPPWSSRHRSQSNGQATPSGQRPCRIFGRTASVSEARQT